MSAIDLPDLPGFSTAVPRRIEYGSWQAGALGGPETYLARLGDRFAVDFTTPQLKPEPTGRLWSSVLSKAIGKRVRIALPILWPVEITGAPLIDGAGQLGVQIDLKGLTAGQIVRDGWYIEVGDGNYGFLHQVQADAAVDGTGRATVTVWPMLRSAPTNNSDVRVLNPRIEGKLIADPKACTMEANRINGFAFTVQEVR